MDMIWWYVQVIHITKMNEIAKWFLALLGALILCFVAFFGIGLVIVYEVVDLTYAILGTVCLVLGLTVIFRFTACRNVNVKRFLWFG